MSPAIKKILPYAGSFLTNGFGNLLGLIVQLTMARLMGVSDYGLLTLSLAVVLLPVSLANLGVGVSVAKFLGEAIGAKDYGLVRELLKQSAAFTAGVAVFLSIVLFLGRDILAGLMGVERLNITLGVLGVCVPFIYLTNWSLQCLKGLGKNATQIALETLVIHFAVGLFALSAWLITSDIKFVCLGYGASYLVIGSLAALSVVKGVADMPKQLVKKNVPFLDVILHGIPINITTLGQRLFKRGDVLVIGVMLGESAVGLYQAAYTMANGIRRLVKPINSFSLFYMAKSLGQKKEDMLSHHFVLSILLSMVIAIPAYLIMGLLGEDILYITFGEEYLGASNVLLILCIGFAVFISIGPVGALFNVMGRNWLRMSIMLGMSLFNVLLNIYFIDLFGLEGAAVATSISFLVLNLIYFVITKNLLKGQRTCVTYVLWFVAAAALLFGYGAKDMDFIIRGLIVLFVSGITMLVGAFLTYRYFMNEVYRDNEASLSKSL